MSELFKSAESAPQKPNQAELKLHIVSDPYKLEFIGAPATSKIESVSRDHDQLYTMTNELADRVQSRLDAAEAAISNLDDNSSNKIIKLAESEMQSAQQAQDNSEMADLIRIGRGSKKTFHRPDGKFLSQNELNMIYDNQDQIRARIDHPETAEAQDEPVPIDQLQTLETHGEQAPAFENGDSVQMVIDEVLDTEGWTIYNSVISKSGKRNYLVINSDKEKSSVVINEEDLLEAQQFGAENNSSDSEHSASDNDGEQPTLPGLENLVEYDETDEEGEEARIQANRKTADGSETSEKLDLTGLDEETPEGIAMLAELDKSLESATNRYAELTAKDRQSYLARFAQEGMLGKDRRFGKLLRKIKGVSGLVDKINERQSEAINQAIADYETTIKAYLGGYDRLLRSERLNEQGEAIELSEAEIGIARIAERINIDYRLELSIAASRKEQGKTAGKFTDWWVSQKGFRGNLKKALVVMGAGFIAGGLATTGLGLVGGAAALGWIGSGTVAGLAGGSAGAGIAHSTTRRRANATVKGSEQTIAQTDSAIDHEAKAKLFDTAESTDTRVDIDYTEKQTDKEMLRNRKRLAIAAKLGFAAGGMAFGLNQAVSHVLNPDTAATSPQHPLNPLKPKVPEVPKPTELLGNNFNVESGHGLTNEWMDWAHANHHALNSRDAWRLHEAVRNHFGDNGIIDKVGTYIQHGDLRIAKPGAAQWDKGVAEFAKNWLSSQGKW